MFAWQNLRNGTEIGMYCSANCGMVSYQNSPYTGSFTQPYPHPLVGGAPAGSPGSIRFIYPTGGIIENQVSYTFIMLREGGASGPVSVSYATRDGTALAGVNYTATSGTMTWADGDNANKSVNVPISNTGFAGTKTFSMQLSNPTGGATLGSITTNTITITGTAQETLAFASDSSSIDQSGTVTNSVVRGNGTTGSVSAHYATADGTALAGRDYVNTTGTLTLGSGVGSGVISVPVTYQAAISNRFFTIVLSSPTGATLIPPQTNTVQILATPFVATVPSTVTISNATLSIVTLIPFPSTKGRKEASFESGPVSAVPMPEAPETPQVLAGPPAYIQHTQYTTNLPTQPFTQPATYSTPNTAIGISTTGLIVTTNAGNGDLNVRSFGVVQDGTNDDTVAFQAAINACPAGGVIKLPAGTIRVTAPITLTTASTGMRKLKGSAFHQTIIRQDGVNMPILKVGYYGAVEDLTLTYQTQATTAHTNSIALALDNLQNTAMCRLGIYNAYHAIGPDPASASYNGQDFSVSWEDIEIGSFTGHAIHKKPINAGSSGSWWRNLYIYNQTYRGSPTLITTDSAIWMSSSEDTFVGLNIEWGSFTSDLAHFQDCPQIVISKYHNEGCVLSNYNIGTIGAVNSYVHVDGHSLYNNTIGPNYSAAIYVLTSGGFDVHGVSDSLLNKGNTNSTWYRFLDFNNTGAVKRIQISGYNKANYNGPAAPSLGDSIVEMGLVEDRDAYAHILGTGFVIDPAIATNSVVINPAGYIGIGVGGASNITARLDITSGTNNGRVRITSDGASAALRLHGWTGVTTNFNTFWLSTGRGPGANDFSIMHPNNFVNGIGYENTNMVDALTVFRDSGHIGIGPTNDSGAILDISAGGANNGRIRLDSTGAVATVKMHGWSGSGTNFSTFWLATSRGPSSGDFSIMRPTNFTSGIGSEGMTDALTLFRDSGHVGIGYTNDNGIMLHVANSFQLDGGGFFGRDVMDSGGYDPTERMYRWSGAATNYSAWYRVVGGVTGLDYVIQRPSNGAQPIGSETMVPALILRRDTGNLEIGGSITSGTDTIVPLGFKQSLDTGGKSYLSQVNGGVVQLRSDATGGGNGNVIINADGNVQLQTPTAVAGQFDGNTTAGNTRFLLWDVSKGTLSRVSVGANDSGGVGFKVLRVPN
jgi:hypothetical protein